MSSINFIALRNLELSLEFWLIPWDFYSQDAFYLHRCLAM